MGASEIMAKLSTLDHNDITVELSATNRNIETSLSRLGTVLIGCYLNVAIIIHRFNQLINISGEAR